MKWTVLILCCVAAAADVYIYRNVVSRIRSCAARRRYLIFAIVTDGAALGALTIYGVAANSGSTALLAAMWCVWLFFLTLAPKVFYVAGALLDGAVERTMRRRRAVTRRGTIVFRVTGLAAAVVVMAVMVHGATAGRTRLRVERVEVASSRLPDVFDGYKIVQFSDLHIGTMGRPEARLAKIAETVAAQRADLVLFTGDLVNLTHEELTEGVLGELAKIDAPDGVWSVWGNHDLGFYIDKRSALSPRENLDSLTVKVSRIGWRVLSDDSAPIFRGYNWFLLTGLDYPRDPMLNSHNESLAGVDISAAFARVDPVDEASPETAPFSVVMAHTPKLWGSILERGRGDLTLSGHVHAMQTKVRLGGRTWSPARYLYDHWSGRYTDEKNRTLYVNDGIGCVGYPMRIGVRGEITVITLRAR